MNWKYEIKGVVMSAIKIDGLPDQEQLLLNEVRRIRRILHSYPELGHQEILTSKFIEDYLCNLGGCEVFRPAATSVCALFGKSKRAILLRADIDALPIQEENKELSCCSKHNGIMHACGHDGHIAALLVLASVLTRHKFNVSRSVLLVFQQAEETSSSGAPLVLSGLPKDLTLIEAYGFHLWPQLSIGTIGLASGPIMASVDGLIISIKTPQIGQTHGDQAEADSVDALRLAIDIYDALRPFMNRRFLTFEQPTSLHIGIVQGGQRPNSVANEAQLRGTLRTISPETRKNTIQEIRKIVIQTCDPYQVEVDIQTNLDIRPHLVNSPNAVTDFTNAAKNNNISVVTYPQKPLGVSEDFGWYLKQCPGAFALVGCTVEGDMLRQLHSSDFDFDERALIGLIQVLETLALGTK